MTKSKLLQQFPEPLDLPLDPAQPRREYQSMLRVIGALLDELAASNIVIIEGTEGFTIRFTSRDQCEIRDLSYTDLLEAYQTLRNERTLLGNVDRGHYQDFLRAIGYEVERLQGRNLLLAQAADHYLLTYQTSASGSSTHHVLLAPRTIQEILDRAHKRRAGSQARESAPDFQQEIGPST